jgi:alkylation response protein AidB-like acyl-CoA dehydrogenase
MNFDDSVGWLVGGPNKGHGAMFTMMNTERVSVGIQGWAWARRAYQAAAWYAETDQGRALSGPKYPDQAADPIIVHPDVRRMLMTMRAYNEGLSCTVGLGVARSMRRSIRRNRKCGSAHRISLR